MMLTSSVFVLLLLELITSHTPKAEAAELYFRLLKKDGKLSDVENPNSLFPPSKLGGDSNSVGSLGNRRPAPSDRLPIDDLLENEGDIYDPKSSDINPSELKRKLGKNYDKDFMSISNPHNRMDEDLPLITFVKGRPEGPRPDFLRLLRSVRLQDGSKLKLNATKKERRKFQKFMWSLTFCPVKYSWKHLGIRFWPRWIREGSCTKKRSCSIPEGMMCKPSASTNKVFFRWHCDDFEKRQACQWIPIQYPIVTECSCSC